MTQEPPFKITGKVLQLVEDIGRELGQLEVSDFVKPDGVKLRRENRAKTIHATLAIEGNRLSVEQVSRILNGEEAFGEERDMIELGNAIEVYGRLAEWDGLSVELFLEAHRVLMLDLVKDQGKFRKKGVGVFNKEGVAHMAPPAEKVEELVVRLFDFLKADSYSWLIKACVCHYEIEFIHPFSDGNGRMGRLWQQVLLVKDHEVFGYISVEELIRKHQQEYYDILGECDKAGESTLFIEFMLRKLLEALERTPRNHSVAYSSMDRLIMAFERLKKVHFVRKDYINLFDVSGATASRDLANAVKAGYVRKEGDRAGTRYQFISNPQLN